MRNNVVAQSAPKAPCPPPDNVRFNDCWVSEGGKGSSLQHCSSVSHSHTDGCLHIPHIYFLLEACGHVHLSTETHTPLRQTPTPYVTEIQSSFSAVGCGHVHTLGSAACQRSRRQGAAVGHRLLLARCTLEGLQMTWNCFIYWSSMRSCS